MIDLARRRLLQGRFGRTPAPVHPPWSDDEALRERCTRCGACAEACPEGIVVAGSGGLPEVDFSRGECTFCRACGEACPEPIFDFGRPAWTLGAAVGDACLAGRGVYCQSCKDACPEGAIGFAPVLGSVPRPGIDLAACTGCGACVSACPADAITVSAAVGEGGAREGGAREDGAGEARGSGA
ncbi:MAG TPA: ferredoxin-type protein NapF [Alphaproteobacteria bacterium]|nr:ferredoxin-type protein NapF [Alphaproteobacteria bacterium]